MRTSIELPDPLFREMKLQAARRGVTLKALIQQAVVKELNRKPEEEYRTKHPLVRGDCRHPINLTNAEIEDIFAEEDFAGIRKYMRLC